MADMKPSTGRRAVLLGLDGTPHPLLRRFADDGTMPRTKALIEGGILRRMESSLPEISSVAWSTMMTGKNPGEHGIYGFTDLVPGTYKIRFPTLRDLRAEPFWAGLNRRGKKTIVINMPSTYPAPDSISGLLISGFVAVDLGKATAPKSLVPRLREMDYRIDVDAKLAHTDLRAFLEDLHRTFDRRADFYRWAWENEPWDFFGLIVTGTDRLHHFLWDAYEDANHPYHASFRGYYKKVDGLIGEVAGRLRPDDALLMMSDHGFCGIEKQANVNGLLEREGFLKLARPAAESLEEIAEGATAFALEPGRIYLHREGKYPRGRVRPDEAAGLLEKVEAALKAWTFEGRPIVDRVFRKEAIYRGPCVAEAPDLVALSHRGFDLKASIRSRDLFTKGVFTGMHTQDDAFLLARGVSSPIPEVPTVADVRGLIDGALA